MSTNDERGRSPARRFPAISEGESKADKVAEMSTGEFRAWAKSLDAKERAYWREYRRKLSKDRYEQKRLAMLRGEAFFDRAGRARCGAGGPKPAFTRW